MPSSHVERPTRFSELLGGSINYGIFDPDEELLPEQPIDVKGAYAKYPAAQPKYSAQYTEENSGMARMLIPLPNLAAASRFVRSFTGQEPRKLAQTLALPPKDDSRGYGFGYIDFLLSTAQENFNEKVDVREVLSDNYVAYFFGQRAPVFRYSGILLNTKQDDWRAAMSVMYQYILRGTQLSRRGVLLSLNYDNVVVTGSMLSLNQTLNSELEMAANFNFDFLVKRYDVYRFPGHKPTKVESYPAQVQPDTFSTIQITQTRRTIRTVSQPTTTTVSRKKSPSSTEEPTESRDDFGA